MTITIWTVYKGREVAMLKSAPNARDAHSVTSAFVEAMASAWEISPQAAAQKIARELQILREKGEILT